MSHSQQLDIKMVESILQSSSIENLDMKEIPCRKIHFQLQTGIHISN